VRTSGLGLGSSGSKLCYGCGAEMGWNWRRGLAFAAVPLPAWFGLLGLTRYFAVAAPSTQRTRCYGRRPHRHPPGIHSLYLIAPLPPPWQVPVEPPVAHPGLRTGFGPGTPHGRVTAGCPLYVGPHPHPAYAQRRFPQADNQVSMSTKCRPTGCK